MILPIPDNEHPKLSFNSFFARKEQLITCLRTPRKRQGSMVPQGSRKRSANHYRLFLLFNFIRQFSDNANPIFEKHIPNVQAAIRYLCIFSSLRLFIKA
jgi:hypothetical protein